MFYVGPIPGSISDQNSNIVCVVWILTCSTWTEAPLWGEDSQDDFWDGDEKIIEEMEQMQQGECVIL